MEDKADKSSGNDRVALKKEIGLLSACAIIIGECGGARGVTWRGGGGAALSFNVMAKVRGQTREGGFGSRSAVGTHNP